MSAAVANEFIGRRFDFIVVGGGTAGLAVASRLAEDPAVTVGVLEAGPAVSGEDDIDIPGRYGHALGGRYDWQFDTVAQPGLGGRVLPFARGKVLGGTSAINFMTWNRANREDYDAWEKLGNPGWGWDSLLPFFKKSETFHTPPPELRDKYRIAYEPSVFGNSGPVHISYTKNHSASHLLWHDTLNALGLKTNNAHLAGSNVGVWTNVCSVNPETAARSYSTGYRLTEPAPPNLHVLTEASVQEVILANQGDEWAATGVRFVHHDREFTVSVTREVIVSAGAVQSPQILELSGIGQPEVLSAAGIPVKVNSPNVGENLQDHIMLATIFEVDPSLANPDDHKHDEALGASVRKQYAEDRSGPLTILPCSLSYLPLSHVVPEDAFAAITSKIAANISGIPAEQHQILQSRFAADVRLGQIEFIFELGNWNPYFQPNLSDGKKYGTMLQMLQHPFSRGSVHIRPGAGSPSTASDKPLIDPGYYAGPHGALDLEIMTHCAEFVDRIGKTPPLADIVRARAFPPPKADLREFVIQNTVTDWHPMGSCSMGPSGVVDERLRVRGVKGLRVIDASIMPLQISAHLQATVYAIAEKGAAIIKEDYAGVS